MCTLQGYGSDMKIICNARANKAHFHKKDFSPNLVLKVRVYGTGKWPT